MWQDRQADLLRDETEVLLAQLSKEAPDLYGLVREPLTKARRGLATEGASVYHWHLLPLLVCEAICDRYEHALPAAVALQFLIAASDVFDDVEDADSSESLPARYGAAVATNAATTLLILAEGAITHLKEQGVADSIIVRVMEAINTYYTTACAGQHLDLSIASGTVLSEETYLKIASMKSASQIECACYVGALLANADQELIRKFSSFGQNLGMAAQIANDIRGITRGRDIAKRRITLPVIFALTETNAETRYQLDDVFIKKLEPVLDPAKIKELLFRTGALHYATVKMEFYKQKALSILSEIEHAGARTERLKLFFQ